MPVPLGLDLYLPVPGDNPLTRARVELGGRLFFDPTLSADGNVSCATCHKPEHGFADTSATSTGVHGRRGHRNAPTLLNVAYRRRLFRDGRVDRLEDQVLHPIQHAIEMGQSLDTLVHSLAAQRDYRRAFERAYGERVTSDGVARSLASFLRTLRSGDAPFDRFRDGNVGALSPEARRGFDIFIRRARCASSHIGPTFIDGNFHNTGVAVRSGDPGRYAITGDKGQRGAFLTPTLRNVAVTGPYMHHGSISSLEDVIEFYDRGGVRNPNLDEAIRSIGLNADERHALLEFLHALTGLAAM